MPTETKLNLILERAHGFDRWELYQRHHEGMEDQLGALGLVLNCVVLWNAVCIDAA
jgi:TnpA family transposase